MYILAGISVIGFLLTNSDNKSNDIIKKEDGNIQENN